METVDLFVVLCKLFSFIEDDCFLFFFTGTSVTRVTATDADDPVYGNSAKLVYSILEGQPYFSIDQSTGKLAKLNPKSQPTMTRLSWMNTNIQQLDYYTYE